MNAYIVAGYRTAVGKAKRGGFRFTRPDDLAVEVIKHLTASVPGLDPKRVDDLIVGNAVQEAEQGMQMGRMISLMALPEEVPGMVINRYCGSGLEAINIASARIHAGLADVIIAGGTESMSLVPVMGYKTALNYEVATKNPTYYTSMGLTAEEVAKDYKISREDMDKFSYDSHMKAIATIKDGKCEVSKGTFATPKMTLTADSSDYVKIFTGEIDGMQAFMQGKLKLAGDLNLAMKLTQMFKIK